MGTFKDKLAPQISEFYEVIVLHDNAPSERRSVLVRLKFGHIPVSNMTQTDEEAAATLTIPTYQPQEEDEFLSMIHIALTLRSDILSHPAYEGVNVSEEEAIKCVPDSLYMFLNPMIGVIISNITRRAFGGAHTSAT